MSSQIFVVIATSNSQKIAEALETTASDGGHYLIKEGTWFAQFDGTSQELAEKLGIRDASNGTGVVTPVSNYSGRGATDMWEWLKVHWPKDLPR
ncbi:MAG TPA: hypothetical protein VGG36_01935 [Rhizomicrobium sp.]|jgi:hypothetical protein